MGKIFGHRGLPRIYRENSITGLNEAFEYCDYVETDVRITADNNLILFHDPDINGQFINELSTEEILHKLNDVEKDELILSMKEKNQLRVSTLRMINASIKDLEISQRINKQTEDASDNDIIGILVRMVKQRKESAETYKQGNRDDLYKKEIEEIKIIEEFLPKQLSEDEIIKIIEDLISQNNISDISGMGLIMSELKKKYSGQLDLGLASQIIKDRINF